MSLRRARARPSVYETLSIAKLRRGAAIQTIRRTRDRFRIADGETVGSFNAPEQKSAAPLPNSLRASRRATPVESLARLRA